MERGDRAALATFLAPALATGAGDVVTLDEDAAHHARVRRLAVGDRVRLTSGAGTLAEGEIARLAKAALEVRVDAATRRDVAPPPAVHLLVPVADRDRMLWLAEKAAELAVTTWVPVLWARSRSVSPRGEGAGFAEKVRRRMAAALEQSAGAWLPVVLPEETPAEAAARFPESTRLLLDAGGAGALAALGGAREAGVALAVGPEGGLEDEERARLLDAGWRAASLAPTVLRFETAAVAAAAVARAAALAADQRGR